MNLALALLVYSVAAFGLAYIVGHSVISLPFRTWLAGKTFARCPVCGDTTEAKFADGFKCDGPGVPDSPAHAPAAFQLVSVASQPRQWLLALLECPACFGFWIGLAVAMIGIPSHAVGDVLTMAIAAPLYTAGSNFLLARATGLMPDPSQQ